jgi:phosphoadenosine phosphosulfate reductase
LIAAAVERFGSRLALVSSFGSEAAVLLHMTASVSRDVPVVSVDTGKHFWQTRYYRSKLVDLLGLRDVRIIGSRASEIARLDPHGSLSSKNTEACCNLRKVRPLEQALAGFEAVLSGRKRYHGGTRSGLKTVASDNAGRLKLEPLAGFSAQDISHYFDAHNLPRHPLVAHGFRSIGCMDCTARGGSDDDPRAGRWSGMEKTECGIHLGADYRFVRGGQ